MALERMSYKFKGAGHEEPEGKRKYEKPSAPLRKVFEKFLEMQPNDHDEAYKMARYLTRKLKIDLHEAQFLLHDCPERTKAGGATWSGIFISAIYNRHPEKYIVFDFDAENPPVKLGFKLSRDRVLINRGTVDSFLGLRADGLIINCGEASGLIGFNSKATVINYGSAGMGLGNKNEGLVINCGEAESIGTGISTVLAVKHPDNYSDIGSKGKTLLEEQCAKMPELIEFLNTFKKKLDKDHIAALKELGNNPKKTIEDKIKEILKRNGYEI